MLTHRLPPPKQKHGRDMSFRSCLIACRRANFCTSRSRRSECGTRRRGAEGLWAEGGCAVGNGAAFCVASVLCVCLCASHRGRKRGRNRLVIGGIFSPAVHLINLLSGRHKVIPDRFPLCLLLLHVHVRSPCFAPHPDVCTALLFPPIGPAFFQYFPLQHISRIW